MNRAAASQTASAPGGQAAYQLAPRLHPHAEQRGQGFVEYAARGCVLLAGEPEAVRGRRLVATVGKRSRPQTSVAENRATRSPDCLKRLAPPVATRRSSEPEGRLGTAREQVFDNVLKRLLE